MKRYFFIAFVLFNIVVCPVFGLESSNHRLQWSYPTGGTVESSPAIADDGTIYVGSYDNNLYAVTPDGNLKWQFPTGDKIESSPAIAADGTIYVGSVDCRFYAVKPNGELKWKYDDPAYDLRFFSSPTIAEDGTIYVAGRQSQGTNFGILYALTPQGEARWYHHLSEHCQFAAVGDDGTIYLQNTSNGMLYALYPEDGSEKWSADLGGRSNSSPAISDDTLYVGNGEKLYALNLGGTVKWTYATEGLIHSSPAIGKDGTIYVGSRDHKLYAVTPQGELQWSYDTGGEIWSSPAVGADGTVYVGSDFGSDSGKLNALDPDGTLKWSFPTDGWVGSSPAIGDDGTIYVGSQDNLLYALESPCGGLADSSWPMFAHDVRHTGRYTGKSSGNLYFPHVASDGQWGTEIAVVNKSSGQVAGTLAAYDGDGNKLEEESLELSGHARRARVVGEAFPDPDEIRYMVFSADSADSADVCGYTKFCQEGKYRVAVPAVREKNRDAIHVPHIASDDAWWTGLALVNTTDTEKTLTIRFDTGRTEQVTMDPGAQKSFSIRDRLGAAQPEIKSAEIEGGAGVIGLELFGHKKMPQLSGVLLRDACADTLYFPHVATEGTWWTGIAAYNPASAGADLTITPYKEDGTPLGEFSGSIPAGGKYLTNAEKSELPEDAAWFRIDATRPLSGFELFCGSSPARLGGYSAVDIKRQKGVFPRLEEAGWTGIAFVNTAASSAEVTLRLYKDNGSLVKQTTKRLDPHAKVVETGQGLFGAAAADGTYIGFSADKDVVGFQLNSSANNRMLDGLPGM